MRVPLVKQTMLVAACVLVSACSNPEGEPGNTTAASANPPSALSTMPSLPAGASSYPAGHPVLSSSSSSTKPVQTIPVQAGVSNQSPPNGTTGNSPHANASAASIPDDSSAPPKIDVGSNFDNLEIGDASLKGKLGILRVGSEPTSNDLLSVFVGLKNKTAHPLALEIQTIYKDRMGNSLNDGSWIPMTLKPHEDTEYRSSSISAEAVDFLVRIRRASNDGAAGTN